MTTMTTMTIMTTMTTHIINQDRSLVWVQGEKLHRDDDLPAVIREDGTKEWYRDGLRHRENGPAIVKDTEEHWFLNGHRHRLDGPAIVVKNRFADLHGMYFIHGEEKFFIKTPEGLIIRKMIDKSAYPSLKNIREQLYSIDDQDLTLFRLRYDVMDIISE